MQNGADHAQSLAQERRAASRAEAGRLDDHRPARLAPAPGPQRASSSRRSSPSSPANVTAWKTWPSAAAVQLGQPCAAAASCRSCSPAPSSASPCAPWARFRGQARRCRPARPVLTFLRFPEAAAYVVSVVLAVGIVVFLHMVVGEMAPKSWAIAHPERSAVLLALPFRGFARVMRPALSVLNAMANGCLRLVGCSRRTSSPRSTGPRSCAAARERQGPRNARRARPPRARRRDRPRHDTGHRRHGALAGLSGSADATTCAEAERVSRDTGRSRLVVTDGDVRSDRSRPRHRARRPATRRQTVTPPAVRSSRSSPCSTPWVMRPTRPARPRRRRGGPGRPCHHGGPARACPRPVRRRDRYLNCCRAHGAHGRHRDQSIAFSDSGTGTAREEVDGSYVVVRLSRRRRGTLLAELSY